MGIVKIKNKGFTLIELLIVVAIIGILSIVVLASLNNYRMCKKDPTREGCNETKEEQTTKKTSDISDKFYRSDTSTVDVTNYNVEDSYEYYREPTIAEACYNVPNVESRIQCELEFTRSQNLRDCVKRYGYED